MFKIGDIVHSDKLGLGKVIGVYDGDYPIEVIFNEDLYSFTEEGFWCKSQIEDNRNIKKAENASSENPAKEPIKFTISESVTKVLELPPNIKYPEAYIQGLQFKISQIEKETKLEISKQDHTIDYCFSLLNQCNELTSPIKEEIAKVIKYIQGTDNE